MHVIGHQGISMYVTAVFVRRVFQPVQITVVILVTKETRPTVMPTLHDVLRVADQIDARAAGYGGLISSGQRRQLFEKRIRLRYLLLAF